MGSIDGASFHANTTAINPSVADFSATYDSKPTDSIRPDVQISSLGQFSKEYPSLYAAMSKTIGQTACDQMKSSNDRINKLIREQGNG